MQKVTAVLLPFLMVVFVAFSAGCIFYAIGEKPSRNLEFGFGCGLLTLVYFLHRKWDRRMPSDRIKD